MRHKGLVDKSSHSATSRSAHVWCIYCQFHNLSSAITCTPECMWVHLLIWSMTATCTSFVNITRKYCVLCNSDFVVNCKVRVWGGSTRYFWPDWHYLMRHSWQSWPFCMATQVISHGQWPLHGRDCVPWSTEVEHRSLCIGGMAELGSWGHRLSRHLPRWDYFYSGPIVLM